MSSELVLTTLVSLLFLFDDDDGNDDDDDNDDGEEEEEGGGGEEEELVWSEPLSWSRIIISDDSDSADFLLLLVFDCLKKLQ